MPYARLIASRQLLRSSRSPWRLLVAAAVVALLVATASAQAAPRSVSAKQAAPIVVGFLAPLTGVAAPDGIQERDGWNLAMKEFGTKVAGRTIQTLFVDTQSDPNVGLTDARNLVQVRHADLIEGPVISSVALAVATFVGPTGVPIDDLSECSIQQLNDYKQYGTGFASGWNCTTPSTIAADYLYRNLHLRHVTTVAMDYSYGWESIGAFVAEFERLGGKVDKEIWGPLTAPDWSPYVSSIPTSTQAVYTTVAGGTAVRFMNPYNDFGLKGKIPLYANTTPTDYSVLPAEKPEAALGVISIGQYCDGVTSKTNKDFVSKYHAAYHTYPGYYGEAGYTKALLLMAALKKTNGQTGKALVDALKTTKVNAPRGPMRISPLVYAPVQNVYVCKVERVGGALRNVQIGVFKHAAPWGALPFNQWLDAFTHNSAGRP